MKKPLDRYRKEFFSLPDKRIFPVHIAARLSLSGGSMKTYIYKASVRVSRESDSFDVRKGAVRAETKIDAKIKVMDYYPSFETFLEFEDAPAMYSGHCIE